MGGAWFACMNYSVHSIIYGYFAIMGTRYRKAVTRYAIYITLLQLVQMLVGMFVTAKAVLYQAAGDDCHVNKTNSVLGLSMYASYFVLFFKLFVARCFCTCAARLIARVCTAAERRPSRESFGRPCRAARCARAAASATGGAYVQNGAPGVCGRMYR